jgi:hypothetical protein
MFEIFLLAAIAIGILITKKSKVQKHPLRLTELEQALRTQADLWLYRNKDVDTAKKFSRLGTHLDTARYLANSPVDSWHQEWMSIRPSLLHCTSEELLKSVDLFYTDRREEIKAAVYDLVTKLDKSYDSRNR